MAETVTTTGTWDSTKEIRVFADRGKYDPSSVMLQKDIGVLPKGQVLGLLDGGAHLYAKYDNTKLDGTQTAICILGHEVDTAGLVKVATAYFRGRFYKANLTGLDAAGEVELKAVSFDDGTVQIR